MLLYNLTQLTVIVINEAVMFNAPISTIPNVLSIAGSDSGGGAGIQADLKTMAALGVYGASVITAVTAQNTLGVTAIHNVPIDVIAAQIEALFVDIKFEVVKIGLLVNVEVINTVADQLASLKQAKKIRHIVFDPVMVATSGDQLLVDSAVATLRTKLMPMATIVTPNLPEASLLIGKTIVTKDDMQIAVDMLRELGAENVLLKGGHLHGQESTDLLIGDSIQWLSAQRIDTNNTHGTGCTLSSAIAAGLAKGESVEEAVVKAKSYVQSAIENADRLSVGNGHGPIHHFYQWY